MDEGVVNAIAELARDSFTPKVVEVDGLVYLSHEVQRPPAQPLATALKVRTLAALVEYVKSITFAFDRGAVEPPHFVEEGETPPLTVIPSWAIHVRDPWCVQLVLPLRGYERTREVLAEVTCEAPQPFGSVNHSVESFVIWLQTGFLPAHDRDVLLKIVSTVRDEKVLTSQDDGVSQVVTARSGVALLADVTLPNPVRLVPYRTFHEVDQPDSLFVVRAKSGEPGKLPLFALFEAEGNAWMLDAVENIRAFLRERLPDAVILA